MGRKELTILFVLTPALNPLRGGVQRTTVKLGTFFASKNINVNYFSFSKDDHAIIDKGCLYHAHLSGELQVKENIDDLYKCVIKVAPDIVINQMPYELELTRVLSELKGEFHFTLVGCLRNSLFSVVNNIDDYIRDVFPKFILNYSYNRFGRYIGLIIHRLKHRYFLRKILKHHDKYVLLAPPNVKELNFFVGGFMRHKVHCIPNSIPSLIRNTQKSKRLLHVGRIDKAQKRSDLLAPIWKECMSMLPDWEFIVIGDGPYKAVLESQIMSMDLQRMRLVGFQDPSEYYRTSSIFMMPSSFEGFPNTILEAQSYGLPVVAFDSYPALQWILRDNVDSKLIKPFDISGMAEAIIDLANNASYCGDMAEAAWNNSERFTIDEVGKLWLDFFETIRRTDNV